MTPELSPDLLRERAWIEWRRLGAGEKFAFARRGLRRILDEFRQGGARGRIAAATLAPVGLLYIVACVLRDSVYYRVGARVGRRLTDRRGYLRHRFGGTQRFVDWRERRLVTSLLARIDPPARVLDAPSGYGRFVPALDGVATRQLVCADIDRPRLLALGAVETVRPLAAIQADLQGALPFRSATFDFVFNLRYLHHARTIDARERALGELARVSRRYVVVSYYGRSNLHALVRRLQHVTRRNRRGSPAMIGRGEFERLLRTTGCRMVRERALLPWFHAQRIVLLERRRTADERPRESVATSANVAA